MVWTLLRVNISHGTSDKFTLNNVQDMVRRELEDDQGDEEDRQSADRTEPCDAADGDMVQISMASRVWAVGIFWHCKLSWICKWSRI